MENAAVNEAHKVSQSQIEVRERDTTKTRDSNSAEAQCGPLCLETVLKHCFAGVRQLDQTRPLNCFSTVQYGQPLAYYPLVVPFGSWALGSRVTVFSAPPPPRQWTEACRLPNC